MKVISPIFFDLEIARSRSNGSRRPRSTRRSTTAMAPVVEAVLLLFDDSVHTFNDVTEALESLGDLGESASKAWNSLFNTN